MDMKKYRLVKWDETYRPLELNGVYDGDFVPLMWFKCVFDDVMDYPEYWEEAHDFQVGEIDGKKHYMMELKEGESLTVIFNGSTTTISV